MSSPVTRMRIAAQVIGTLFQLVGIGLVLTALLTAAWQVVYIDQTKMLHQHGLWLDCVQVGQSSIVHTADSSGWSCTYKFAEKDRSASGEPTSKTWQIVLALLSGGGLFSVIGLFVSYCICCPRVSSICWVITNTFAAFASAAGIIVFFRSSHELRNRIYLVLTTSYVQQLGYSFWLAVAACGLQMAALCCSIVYSILVFVGRSYQQSTNTWSKSQKMHNTTV
ncbi:hypothetical protein M514_04741 [Trichuris suis]|uniref:Uncharacterized protein n=1 Tax=Trichuris suis TaxID=68888 RepID=A0A085MWS5_9BILA|nr:hypothetical protein M514_04741 [Trichuris suis]KHJ42276.1 Clc-like protein [Trichuris suis]